MLDGVYNEFKDAEGFRAECEHGRDLGMDGKTLIHPNQIAVANEVFAPPEAEVAFARKIIAAFDQPESGQGRDRGRGQHGRTAARRDGAPHRRHRRGDSRHGLIAYKV